MAGSRENTSDVASDPRCVCAEINTRHCPVHGQGEAEAGASEAEYERRMTCPRCGQYGDGCNCDAALRYQEAVERWALCIHLDNGLQGITMGHVFDRGRPATASRSRMGCGGLPKWLTK